MENHENNESCKNHKNTGNSRPYLKSCPFCRCRDAVVEKVTYEDGDWWIVSCENECCGSRTAEWASVEIAIAHWNVRQRFTRRR